jgi:hypothetical protein
MECEQKEEKETSSEDDSRKHRPLCQRITSDVNLKEL